MVYVVSTDLHTNKGSSMSITVLEDSTVETRYYVRTIALENVAPILLERKYSHGGKEFLPDSASTKWGHDEGLTYIDLGGYVLKKDRTTGQQRAVTRYVTPASNSWDTRWGTNAPAWLLELFDIEATK